MVFWFILAAVFILFPLIGAAVLFVFIGRIKENAGLSAQDVRDMVKDVKAVPQTPQPRSVFGATSIYLPQIERDFADFHPNEAIAAVRALVCEYLAVRYEGQKGFVQSHVAPQLLPMVDRDPGHTVREEQVHQVAISKYVKTKEYATITYQASVGYLLDGEPREERYAVEYTLRLRENDIEQKTLICPQCGGTYESTSQTVCPFCGAGMLRDTILSWIFTSIQPS